MHHLNRIMFIVICIGFITIGSNSVFGTDASESMDEQSTFSLTTDMSRVMLEEAASVRESIEIQAKSLFERKSLGFNIDTIQKSFKWLMLLPLQIPDWIESLSDQTRFLGFVGSGLIILFFLLLFYSFFGIQNIRKRLQELVDPLIPKLKSSFQPYLESIINIVSNSLIPIGLYGIYCLVFAMTSFTAPWFIATGQIIKLWAWGAIILTALREIFGKDRLPVDRAYQLWIFRWSRFSTIFILGCMAILEFTKAFRAPDDIVSLFKFLISIAVVFAIFLIISKKQAIISLIPDLPYPGYKLVVRLFIRLYNPIIILTFISGLLWSVGYHRLCQMLWTKTWFVAAFFLTLMLLFHWFQNLLKNWIRKKDIHDEAAQFLYQSLRSVLILSTIVIAIVVTLEMIGLLELLKRIISFPIAEIGIVPISVWTLAKATVVFLIFVYLSRLLRAYLDYKIYPKLGLEEGLAYSINTFLGYVLIAIGLLFSLRIIGLDFKLLLVFAGALGVGVGLGLQNLASNVISGFILIFGRRIRKGDWIKVGDTVGYVKEVNLRATKIRTRDNVEYLVPNSELTATTIVNYTLSDPEIRIHVPVGVSYSSNPETVQKILFKASQNNLKLSHHREPEVWFKGYGESSIDFKLLVWIDIRKFAEEAVRSELYFYIFSALAEAKIEIPYPQRDLHLKSGQFIQSPTKKE